MAQSNESLDDTTTVTTALTTEEKKDNKTALLNESGGLDDDSNNDKKYTLISGQTDKEAKKSFEITATQAKLAKLIQTMIQGDQTATEFPLPQVPPKTLENVVEYLEHHNGKKPEEIATPVRSVNMAQVVVDKWDADFIDKFEKKEIFDIILAANYLDINGLLHLGCAKIATLIKQLSQKEINEIIEAEEKYRRENKINENVGDKDKKTDNTVSKDNGQTASNSD